MKNPAFGSAMPLQMRNGNESHFMDAIADRVVTDFGHPETFTDDPSLLTVILDLNPLGWYNIRNRTTVKEVTKSLIVFMNAHLSLNNSNRVAFLTASPSGARFLYPNTMSDQKDTANTLVNRGMYRQFRIVDETVLLELNNEFQAVAQTELTDYKSTVSGALSLALTYTHRMLTLDESISTTTASAISTSTNVASNSSAAGAGSTGASNLISMKSRILVVSPDDNDDIRYIPIMNSIFAAQKMKVSIDVVKLGSKDVSYLQQAADATNGVYLHVQNPEGLIQVRSTAYFIEPSLRPLVVLPTNSNVNYRASCFVTGKSIDLGFVCSVCLCIMSIIPDLGKCPTCQSEFDPNILSQLRRSPAVLPRKKRKVDPPNGTPAA